jgi:long-subunit acyl-CoA synthetase (AMP-forming)
MELFFTEKLDTFVSDLNHAKPTVFISVPRLWTRFQSQVLAKFPETELQSLLQQPETGEALAAQIREQLGFGHGRIFGSGSAPIAPSLLEWFDKLGVPISEGWGMTETSGMACTNLPYEPEGLGTIGRPIDGVEMKLSEEGEVLIRGDVVFSEYYRNPEATAEAFVDGWFRTGDRGEITESGHFKIIGRLKEQFKTAKGKYVAPVPIESMLAHNPDVEQVCVLGAGRKQPIAVVVLAEELRNDVSKMESIRKRLQETLVMTNENLESHQRLDNILVSDTPWTVDNGLLTPTLKIRRNKVEEIYADLLTYRMPTPVYWL